MHGKSLAFKVYFSRKFLKQLQSLDSQTQTRVKEAVKRLEKYPSDIEIGKVKKFSDVFKLRIGDWRVFFRYKFPTQEVEIISIRPRDKA